MKPETKTALLLLFAAAAYAQQPNPTKEPNTAETVLTQIAFYFITGAVYTYGTRNRRHNENDPCWPKSDIACFLLWPASLAAAMLSPFFCPRRSVRVVAAPRIQQHTTNVYTTTNLIYQPPTLPDSTTPSTPDASTKEIEGEQPSTVYSPS